MSNPLVRKLEAFGRLTAAERDILERISAPSHLVGARIDLIREGDPPDGVVLIMEGIACRQKHRANGSRQITAYLVPGDACDLDVALLSRMDHTITTLSTCRVVRIPSDVVARLMAEHPAIAKTLRMANLVDEATLREWLVNVGCRSAIERIAHLFCELLVRLQVVGLASEDSYELPVTQLDLADTVGLSLLGDLDSLDWAPRAEVHQATGMVTAQLRIPPGDALAVLRAHAYAQGTTVAAVASDLLDGRLVLGPGDTST